MAQSHPLTHSTSTPNHLKNRLLKILFGHYRNLTFPSFSNFPFQGVGVYTFVVVCYLYRIIIIETPGPSKRTDTYH